MPATAPRLELNDGRAIPQLGLGVWQATNDEVERAVRQAFSVGYRLIDTAAIYRNEEGVGRAMADAPEDLFLTTKVWNSEQGYDSTLRAFDASMSKLKREVLDLYLIHWPLPKKGLYVDTWRAMIRLQQEGRIRSIGVSNFTEPCLQKLVDETGVTPVVNQIELHPRFQQRGLRAVDARFGILTESWSPLGQGSVLGDPVIAAIARKHGKTAAQVIIRWHLDNGLVVIPKSVTPSRIGENFDVFDFSLDAEDRTRIDGLDSEDGRMGEHPDLSF